MSIEPPRPQSHRRVSALTPRWLAAGGAVVLAGIVGVAILLQNSGSACAAPPSTSAHDGKATFYDLGGGMGNCSYPSAPDDDLFVALGPDQYSSAAACGTYLDVTGPKGKVRVKVIDSCPECEVGHLDLSRTAFKKIGVESDGIIPITYKTVASPTVPGPISVRLKEGSSQYWFAALIDNAGTQLTSVKVAGPSGTFHTATRADYNYWEIDSGAGSGPFTIKITDVNGRTATLSKIKLSPGSTQSTSVKLSGVASSSASAAKSTAAPAKTSSSPKPAKSSASPSASAAASTESAQAEALAATDAATTAPAETSVDLAAGTHSCG